MLWTALKADQEWPARVPQTDAAKAVTVAPSGVRLELLNGTGVDGKARAVAEQLKPFGYSITKLAKAAATVSKSTLAYGTGREESVKTIAAATGLTAVFDPKMGKHIVLTVGPDGVTVSKVTVAKKPTPGELAQQGVTADTAVCVSTK
jgi:hypothetical protein